MRYPWILALTVCTALVSPAQISAAKAESLTEALAAAYEGNPDIEAARAELRAIDEGVAQARGGWRPRANAQGAISRSNTEQISTISGFPERRDNTLTGKSASVAVEQPVFRGFRTVSESRQAKNRVYAGRENLEQTESDVLLDAVAAYMDVTRDQAVLELNRNNVQVLQRQLEASQDRFRVGEITRTDVAQSEARLSRANSDRILAEARLAASRALFNRVIGFMPGTLAPVTTLPELPESEAAAIETALADNPLLNAVRYNERASADAIGVAKSGLLPEISLRAEYGRDWDTSVFTPESTRKQVSAQLRIPLYEAGIQSSLVREARQINNQYRLLIVSAERQTVENTRNAWEALREARSRIISTGEQVRANEIALEGVRQEADVGARTTLDVLDAEQELLDSRVALVSAQRDEVVAAYALLGALGRLNADYLELPVERYDATRNYERVSDKIWGWGIEDE